jgi:hypothetical protein
LFRLRSSLQYWKDSYCESDFGRCKRFQSMVDGRPPPPTMLPNGKDVHALPGGGSGG